MLYYKPKLHYIMIHLRFEYKKLGIIYALTLNTKSYLKLWGFLRIFEY